MGRTAEGEARRVLGLELALAMGVGLIASAVGLRSAEGQETVPQPGESARQSADEAEESESGDEPGSMHSWEVEPVYESEVHAPRALREEDLIGEYAQPRWSARRLFPLTRIFIIPAGQFELEWWLETKLSLENSDDVRYRSQYELEMGLGHHLQLDLYLTTEQLGHDGAFALASEKAELRWALADWGRIWANPTLYFEWSRNTDEPPRGEMKLLLGGELGEGWHGGLNLVWERGFGGENEHEYAVTAGIARTIVDESLSFGGEVKLEMVDVEDHRFAFDAYEAMAGPSLQVRPVPAMHVDLVFPIGFETEGDETTALMEPLLIAGWEL